MNNTCQRKMLVLGSDFFTLPVVEEAHKLGVYVIVADLMETSPTKEAADEKWLISTTDIDSLEIKCRENSISAVMFGASDFNVGNARLLCRRLGLPIYCDGDLAWNTSRDKWAFKQACKRNGAPVARDYYLSDIPTNEELSKIEYPVVVKPVDLSGNRGISFCNNQEELIRGYEYAKSVTKGDHIIVEQRLSGTEHHVNYVLADGNVQLVSFAEANHDSKQLSNVYSFERNTSRYLKQYLSEVNESLIRVFKDLGCKEGIVWADTMRNEADGKFYILEMGYRFAGAAASCPLYEKVTGFNAVKWMVECSLGIEHTKKQMPKPLNEAYLSTFGLAHMFTNKSGRISRIEGLEVLNSLQNVSIDMPKRVGDSFRGYMTVALISIYGKDCDELVSTLKIVNEAFKVFDENGDNILIYYTDYEHIFSTYKEGLVDFHK